MCAVGPYVDSILYNLIRNSIKYRHLDRYLTSKSEQSWRTTIKLTIANNGLGIDLIKYWKSMFGLYKRFHLHMEGRGLGLYLIKTQMAALGGKVNVEKQARHWHHILHLFQEGDIGVKSHQK